MAAQRQTIEEILSLVVKMTLKDGNGKSVIECAKSELIREVLSGKAQ